MRHWIAWTGAVVTLLGSMPLVAEMVTLAPARDNTIFSANDHASNALGILFTSTTNQGNRRRALLAFDVAGHIPAGSTITAASLTLTLDEAAGDGMDLDHDLHRLLQDWGEGTSFGSSGNGAPATPGDATWAFRLYPDTLWSAPGGDFVPTASATAIVGDEPGPITWGSTPGMVADAQAWLDAPDESFGWILVGSENILGTARKFVNREAPDPDSRPMLTIEFTPPVHANFQVTKVFSDGRDDVVEVTLACNTGLPLAQSAGIAGGGTGVNFVVTELQGQEASCEVTETAGPAGYTAVFNNGTGCRWDAVAGGQYLCGINNLAEPATFEVTKEWIFAGRETEGVPLEAAVSIYCNNEISAGFFNGTEYQYDEILSGDLDSLEVSIDTLARAAECRAQEGVTQSGVERESDCDARVIPAGETSSCRITNTVLFEGIPTLSAVGLSMLAFLVLGIGIFGLRRPA